MHVGPHLLRTAGNGVAGLELAPGSYPVTAAKAEYVGATTNVSVRAPKR